MQLWLCLQVALAVVVERHHRHHHRLRHHHRQPVGHEDAGTAFLRRARQHHVLEREAPETDPDADFLTDDSPEPALAPEVEELPPSPTDVEEPAAPVLEDHVLANAVDVEEPETNAEAAPSPSPDAGAPSPSPPEADVESMDGGLQAEHYEGNTAISENGQKAHQNAIDAMGDMKLDNLQPDYVYDDDYADPENSPYEVLADQREKAANRARELEAAEKVKKEELAKLEAAKAKAESAEKDLAEKEAAAKELQDNLNSFHFKDEEAILNQTQAAYEAVKDKHDRLDDSLDDAKKALREREKKQHTLEREAKKLAEEEKAAKQAAEEAKAAEKPYEALKENIAQIKKRSEHLAEEQARLANESSTKEEELTAMGDLKAKYDAAQQTLAELDDSLAQNANDTQGLAASIAEAKENVTHWRAEVDKWPQEQEAAEAKLAEAEKNHADALADYSEEDYQAAKEKVKGVEEEMQAVEEQLAAARGQVESQTKLHDDARREVGARDEVFHAAVEGVRDAEEAVKPATTTAAPAFGGQLAWNDPAHWLG